MSTPPSPPIADSAGTTIRFPASFKSDDEVFPRLPSHWATEGAFETFVTTPDDQTNKQDTREDTKAMGLSSYTVDEKNDLKEDLLQHFEASHTRQSFTTSRTLLSRQRKLPSPSLDYRKKIEGARKWHEQAIIRREKRVGVLQQHRSIYSPSTRQKSRSFMFFRGQQSELCTGCLCVVGFLKKQNVRCVRPLSGCSLASNAKYPFKNRA